MSDLRRWAETWKRAQSALDALDTPPIDTMAAVLQLMPAFRLAREAQPHTVTSGLVTMRRLLDQKRG